jgi:hypothetical protein
MGHMGLMRRKCVLKASPTPRTRGASTSAAEEPLTGGARCLSDIAASGAGYVRVRVAKSDPRAPRRRSRSQRYISALDREGLGFGNDPAAPGRGRDPSQRWARRLPRGRGVQFGLRLSTPGR